MRTIVYSEVHTGADVDALDGTELENMPGDGLLTIRAASTVNTATLLVQSPNQPAVSVARAITLRANGEIRSYDTAWVLSVVKGERVTVGLGGTTGTVYLLATFVGGG